MEGEKVTAGELLNHLLPDIELNKITIVDEILQEKHREAQAKAREMMIKNRKKKGLPIEDLPLAEVSV